VMGALFTNLRAIIEDLKTSWYFRVWAALWFVCALMSFVVLIILGARSNTAAKEKDFNVWVENATEITFPRFHFRLSEHSEQGETFETSTFHCKRNGASVLHSQCASWRGNAPEPQTKCIAVNADGITVQQKYHEPFDLLRIQCSFKTKGYNPSKNSLVALELEGHYAHFGNAEASLHISPTQNAHVYLSKSVISLEKHKTFDSWRKQLVYHSTVHNPGEYTVSVILRSFHIEHIEQSDFYPGWVAVGDIGTKFFIFTYFSNRWVCFLYALSPYSINDGRWSCS